MEIDVNSLAALYFTFDKPVPYKLKCGETIHLLPVNVENSMIFLTSYGILDFDKNASNNIEDISMSYLQYLTKHQLLTAQGKQQLINICLLCLGFKSPEIIFDEKQKPTLIEMREDGTYLSITPKEFDEIKKIILYQNLLRYDDSYINPDLKANMQEQDRLNMSGIDVPNLERKIAIITSHCGISKKEQMQMTFRSHTLLFQEVQGEVEYAAQKGAACVGGEADKIQWIYKKSKSKFDGYITSVESYNKAMGGDGKVSVSTSVSTL